MLKSSAGEPKMQLIYDLEEAKSYLNRRQPRLPEVSGRLKQRLRETFGELEVEEVVEQIIQAVRERGDAALREYTELLDGVQLTQLEVSPEELEAARKEVSPELLQALELAAERIYSFHRAQAERWLGGELGKGLSWLRRPLERVGIYVPGGMASYPSTVLMTVIPARVAGVEEVILATPPRKDGSVHPATLVAAQLSGTSRIFKIGGAQAIAALAFGTESIPKVDKICGPGNIFVTLAKKKVYGWVDIDGLQGPTETLILADESANPSLCAADLLAQAEHDELATAILITTSPELARKASKELDRQLEELGSQVAQSSLEERGKIIVVPGLDEAAELVNLYAPEHLSLMLKDPSFLLDKIRHAGAIFVGESSPEVLGDYLAGPSHVLPTGGTARFASPLNVADFLKFTALVELDEVDLQSLGPAAATMAKAEGLPAHARAIQRRLK